MCTITGVPSAVPVLVHLDLLSVELLEPTNLSRPDTVALPAPLDHYFLRQASACVIESVNPLKRVYRDRLSTQ